MKRILVWDLATRFLHWGLAASVIGAFACAWLGDGHGPVFALHVLCGLAAIGFVALRIGWGVLGTGHARFVNYPLSPVALIRYLADAMRGRWTRFPGIAADGGAGDGARLRVPRGDFGRHVCRRAPLDRVAGRRPGGAREAAPARQRGVDRTKSRPLG
jgi:hypothetical protein